jgi:hypothetical protein
MIGRENRSTRVKPAPMPLCPPQTPHAAQTRTRAVVVGSQRLTTWAPVRPIFSDGMQWNVACLPMFRRDFCKFLSLYMTSHPRRYCCSHWELCPSWYLTRLFSTVFTEHSFTDHIIFNNLPFYLRSLINEKAHYKIVPKLYLNTHSSFRWIFVVQKMTHPFEDCVNSISWQYLCKYVDVFFNSLMCDHCIFLDFLMWKLQLYCAYVFVFIWYTPHPAVIFTKSGSRECNKT